eukprot:6303085-Prymnesium_polylepis.1
MNINLCRKLGIKPRCFRKTIICEANRVTDCARVTSAMQMHRNILKRANVPPMGFKRLRDVETADKLRNESPNRKKALETTMCMLYQQGKVHNLDPSHKQTRHRSNACPVYPRHDRRVSRTAPERKAQRQIIHEIGDHVRVTWGVGDTDYECPFEEA